MRTHPKDNMEKAESDAIKFPYVDEGGIGKLYGGTWSRATGTNTPSPPVTCQRQATPRLPRSPRASVCDRYLAPFPHHPSAERRGSRGSLGRHRSDAPRGSRSARPVASVPFPPEPDRFRTRGRKGVSGHQGRLGVLGGLADRVFISLSIVHNCKNGYFRGAWGGRGRG